MKRVNEKTTVWYEVVEHRLHSSETIHSADTFEEAEEYITKYMPNAKNLRIQKVTIKVMARSQ